MPAVEQIEDGNGRWCLQEERSGRRKKVAAGNHGRRRRIHRAPPHRMEPPDWRGTQAIRAAGGMGCKVAGRITPVRLDFFHDHWTAHVPRLLDRKSTRLNS